METPDRKEPSLWVALERLGHAVGSSAGDLLWSLVEEAPIRLCYHRAFFYLLNAGRSAETAADSCVYNFPSPLLINEFWAWCSPWIDVYITGWWQVILAGEPHNTWALVLIRGVAGHAWGWVKSGWDNRTQALCMKVNHPNTIHRCSQI